MQSGIDIKPTLYFILDLRVPPVVENTQQILNAQSQASQSPPIDQSADDTSHDTYESFQSRALKSVVGGKESVSMVRERREMQNVYDKYSGSNEEPIKRKSRRRKRATNFDEFAIDKMFQIFRKKAAVTSANCHTLSQSALELPGEVAYGADSQFDNQARMALRISHLLSNFMQNVAPDENFGYLITGGRLHQDILFGEVLSNVLADFKVAESGIYYEPYVFENQDGTSRELFGPKAWRVDDENKFYALDSAGLKRRYTDESWYQTLKQRWLTNTHGLKNYRMKAHVRNDPNGTSAVKHEHYPVRYWAPAVKDGHWTRPYFKCDDRVNKWVVTYAVPFIGHDGIKKKLQFK